MTDRELLELAVKAAGYWLRSERDSDFQSDKVWISTQSLDGVRYWPEWKVFDPISDDGDALRLAVKLGISIGQWPDEDGEGSYCATSDEITETLGENPCAATRRAIVRAAAEIGKAMQ